MHVTRCGPANRTPPSPAGDLKSGQVKHPKRVSRKRVGRAPARGTAVLPPLATLCRDPSLRWSEKTLKGWPHSAETSFKRKLLHFALHLEINVGLSIFIAHLMDEVLPLQLSPGPASAGVQTVHSACPAAQDQVEKCLGRSAGPTAWQPRVPAPALR